VDEPQATWEYADVLTRVAAGGKAVIIRRNGADLVAVIPLEHLDLVREVLAWDEVEKLAKLIDWERARQTLHPPQSWFGDTDNPCELEEEPVPRIGPAHRPRR
jgi:hypothetical protein